MKQRTLYLLLAIMSISLLSCSEGPINKITFQNLAAGDVYVNFKGSQIEVPSQTSVVLEDIDKGEYEYETVFSIPYGTTSFSSEGDISGTFIFRAGTKILVMYTSVLTDGVYTIYASVTVSDDINWDDGINPINP
jgi:hypothetical protein